GCYPLQLIVKSQYGCADTLNSEICVEMEFEFYVPNSFTPNDDGINEIFSPLGTGVSETDYEFMIFDRWGSEIFKTNRWGDGWNGKVKEGGKLVQLGTYVWMVRVFDIQGNFHQYTGRVSVIN
ncbi:MAG: gliding motility-associated C-terminal domain-containing protein, partial [Bacteroidia bacterium]|nr:gliding motility-associated C-terminal domain-containing protein [Bacteroidia bacterium]